MTDQAQPLREMVQAARRARQRARVVAVTSGKGGVGKTNLAANLGLLLVGRGQRVALLDADLGLANVDIVLGIDPPFTLSHVLSGERSLAEVMVEGPKGLKVLAGGSGVFELANLSQWRLERFIRALESLDDSLDLLLLDTGAGIGRQVMAFNLASQELIVVTTPEPTSLADAYSVIKVVATRRADVRLLVAVNMAPSLREGEAVFERLSTVARRFLGVQLEHLGTIPRDEAVVRAVQRQEPFVLASPHAPASRAVASMADKLSGFKQPEPTGVAGFLQRILRLAR
ncbi:MAG: MinD/ParA family protein [Firmicutes bacterium]|nr:MinD/ParA family protein [Bacillota bacterium]